MKKKKSLASIITEIVIWTIVAVFLLLILLRKNIFPDDSIFANLYNNLSTFDSSTLTVVRILRTVVIVFTALLISRVIRFLLGLIKYKNQRVQTAISLLQSIIKYAALIAALLMVLSTWGVNTTTLIASAGILTLVIGLGCQSLIADIVAGLFILFEGDFQVGDTVVIGGWRGVVQAIGIRTTKIVDLSGNVKIINNSNISDIVNNSKQLSVASCECDVDYDESIERVESVIQANLDYIHKRIPAIVEGPYYKGVEKLGASGVTIKIVAKVKEEDKYQVQRDMNREIKIIFDKNNVSIPFDQIVVSDRTPIAEFKAKNMDDFVDEQRELSKDFEDIE
jgi:small conductance mechanosensitive channel